MTPDNSVGFPRIEPLGLDGFLVRFADQLSDRANRAAQGYRAAVDAAGIPTVLETASSLGSVHVRFDPQRAAHSAMQDDLNSLLADRDWYDAALPANRRLWKVPTIYGGETGPHMDRAAEMAGLSVERAIENLSTTRLRVLALGFAPGQPYVGQLGGSWDLPRQTDLQTRVPPGTLAIAVRQFVLFTAESQTGWYNIAQTGFQCFQPDSEPPFPLRPGDEMEFPSVPADALEHLQSDPSGNGRATCEPLS